MGGLQALLSYVSKYTPPDSGLVTDSASALTHKTWASVLDRALNMFSTAVSEIVGTVEKVAPSVWKIMIRQQYAKAGSGIVLPLGFLLIIIFFYHFMKKKWTSTTDETLDKMIDGYEDWWAWFWRVLITKCIPLFGAVIAGGFLISAIQDAVLYCANPYYYAIRDILVLLLGKTYGM